MIKMDHVVLDILRRSNDVADKFRVGRNFDSKRVFHCTHRSERMNRSANSADTLRPDPRFARVAPAKDQFDAAEHRSGTPGIGDRAAFHLRLDSQMALNPGHGIYNNACHNEPPMTWRTHLGWFSGLQRASFPLARDRELRWLSRER